MIKRIGLSGCVVLLAGLQAWAGEAPPAVVARQGERSIHLDNGVVSLDVSRVTGQLTSLAKNLSGEWRQLVTEDEGVYWDANAEVDNPPAGAKPPKKGYFRPTHAPEDVVIAASSEDAADVVVHVKPSTFFQFYVDYHFVLRRGDSGFYSYVVVKHPAELAAATLWQTRFVLRTADTAGFETWSTDGQKLVNIPKSAIVKELMDATFLLADGTIKSKYMNSVYWSQAVVYGAFTKDVGIWMLTASPEYHNGGPIKQGQTVHDSVILRVLQSVHFGASPVKVADGEAWQKVYGPFFCYINAGKTTEELLADAHERQQREVAQWPYAWVSDRAYVQQRGTLSGRVDLPGKSPAGAWAILSAPGVDWPASSKGYQFWTHVRADGTFDMNNVVPGRYTLYLSGGDEPKDFSLADVEITGGKTTNLGTVVWQPVRHGDTLWQIGTFDRSAHEFRNGDDARNYRMFDRYPKQFPEDVTFTVGKSDPAKDWNYAQWSWYMHDPSWRIRFDRAASAAGQATLTIGVASAQPESGDKTDVAVALNGKEIGAIRLPKTGTAGYRGGVQDSQYNVVTLTFDAALLAGGANEMTLTHRGGKPFVDAAQKALPGTEDKPGAGFPGQVMYDAIRLEVGK